MCSVTRAVDATSPPSLGPCFSCAGVFETKHQAVYHFAPDDFHRLQFTLKYSIPTKEKRKRVWQKVTFVKSGQWSGGCSLWLSFSTVLRLQLSTSLEKSKNKGSSASAPHPPQALPRFPGPTQKPVSWGSFQRPRDLSSCIFINSRL